MEISRTQKQSQGARSSPKTDSVKGESQCSRGHSPLSSPDNMIVTVNDAEDAQGCLSVPDTLLEASPELSPSLSDGWTHSCSSVRKSRTHDCVMGTGLEEPDSPGHRDLPWTPTTCPHHRLINSASFSGFGASPMLLCENPHPSGSNRELIDYRNLTPPVPFVPSIAKCIPKKRIFLRKPKKAIKDLFIPKKHSSEKAVSPCTQTEGRTKRMKRASRRRDRTRTSNGSNDELSDSSSECCTGVCEDAASLKSFGSQAGCGEIFADEEYLVSLEGSPKVDMGKDASESAKQRLTTAAFQGGIEQLASPAQPEVLDLFGMWETFNRTILYSQSSSPDSNTTPTSVSVSPSPKRPGHLLQSPAVLAPERKIKELSDMTTPKSENQESTSDEGYCEDHTRGSLTPIISDKIPRDTYSGDALYELFYDPTEAEMTPIFHDDMDLTHSIMGQYSDLPLSMYSFHVGAEENLAPPLALDVINHDLLQSNWVGKDCLLKLCDTEISLAMGIVNWMKQKTVNSSPAEITPSEDCGDVFHEDKTLQAETKNVHGNAVLRTERGKEDMADNELMNKRQLDVAHVSVDNSKEHGGVVSTVRSPESKPRTPTHQVCFRIFNINSPLTPSRDLSSPMAVSPGSGTSSLFVLAINKESLCDFCKASLRTGAKELRLCHSCTSFIERIKTSEVWAHAGVCQSRTAGTPQSLKGGLLPSPCSSYGVASDISLLSLVEQCASQLSSLKIKQNISDYIPEARVDTMLEQDSQMKNDSAQKYPKTKHRRKAKVAVKGDFKVKDGFIHADHSQSLTEPRGRSLVITNDSDDLHLEMYNSPHSLKTNVVHDTDISQSSRPTSLPLLYSACSEFSRKEHSSVTKVKEKHHKRSGRHKKSMKRESLQDVFQEEKKVERKHRMKN